MHSMMVGHSRMDFPDFGGPTRASLIGTEGPGGAWERNFVGLAKNSVLASTEEVK